MVLYPNLVNNFFVFLFVVGKAYLSDPFLTAYMASLSSMKSELATKQCTAKVSILLHT